MLKKLFRYFFPRPILVGKVNYAIVFSARYATHEDRGRKNYVTYYLYESCTGHRSYDAVGFEYSCMIKTTKAYVGVVSPFLHGFPLDEQYKIQL